MDYVLGLHQHHLLWHRKGKAASLEEEKRSCACVCMVLSQSNSACEAGVREAGVWEACLLVQHVLNCLKSPFLPLKPLLRRQLTTTRGDYGHPVGGQPTFAAWTVEEDRRCFQARTPTTTTTTMTLTTHTNTNTNTTPTSSSSSGQEGGAQRTRRLSSPLLS